jgi:hypothetical protein
LTSAARGDQHQVKTVTYLFYSIFYSNAGHAGLQCLGFL